MGVFPHSNEKSDSALPQIPLSVFLGSTIFPYWEILWTRSSSIVDYPNNKHHDINVCIRTDAHKDLRLFLDQSLVPCLLIGRSIHSRTATRVKGTLTCPNHRRVQVCLLMLCPADTTSLPPYCKKGMGLSLLPAKTPLSLSFIL